MTAEGNSSFAGSAAWISAVVERPAAATRKWRRCIMSSRCLVQKAGQEGPVYRFPAAFLAGGALLPRLRNFPWNKGQAKQTGCHSLAHFEVALHVAPGV